MTSPTAISVRDWWNERAQWWFKQKLQDLTLSVAQIDRLVRLATDARMRPVAEQLAREDLERDTYLEKYAFRSEETKSTDYEAEEFIDAPRPDLRSDEPSIWLLESAWEAPDDWKVETKNVRRDRAAELKKFSDQCKDFVASLHRERALIQYWLLLQEPPPGVESRWDLHNPNDRDKIYPEYLRPPEEKLASIIETVKALSKAAKEEFKGIPDPLRYSGPTHRNSSTAEENFCIARLVLIRWISSPEPAHEEISTMVEVSLNSSEAIDVDRVRNVWRNLQTKTGQRWLDAPLKRPETK
jgi:hypothetical protein